MKTTKIVASLVERAADESNGSPAWLKDAFRLLNLADNQVTLVGAAAELPDEGEDTDEIDAYALFAVNKAFRFAGTSNISQVARMSDIDKFTAKHHLDTEFGIYKGKLAILLSTDCELYQIKDMT